MREKEFKRHGGSTQNVQCLIIKVLEGWTENGRKKIMKELREENFPKVKKELNL